MKYLVTSEEMKKYDSNTIGKIGIPGMVLMERAAVAVVEQITELVKKRFVKEQQEGLRVCIVAGMGNNGGDGLAVARLLSEKKYCVDVCLVGDESKASEQWRKQHDILQNYPVTVGTKIKENEYNIWVDALFGVGLSRIVEGKYAQVIEQMNRKGGYKIAVDVPSGLDSDTGRVLGGVVKADITVTFGFCKRGLVFFPGCEYAGDVIVADIGIGEKSFFDEVPQMFCYEEPVKNLLPVREAGGNKGTFGKVLLVGGSVNMAGAAILAARAAYRAGAGMVKVVTPSENRVIIQETLPEALLGTYDDLNVSLEWADVVVIGPGIGKSKASKHCLERVIDYIRQKRKPLLIDADGLNLLAEDSGLQQAVCNLSGEVILTPHVGELARLTGQSVEALKENLSVHAMQFAKKLHVIVVAKDARTFVCKEGKPVCVNIRGNSGMATAGSGDVLSGIIAAMLSQGMDAFEAASVGVYLHACAGDLVACEIGEYSLMAGDIIERISILQ
uniref:NAD(P)H-hydrate dehydratase n=1 Tax=Acetatifactor sp. TaxID=1872090 RepID=UPI00405740CB